MQANAPSQAVAVTKDDATISQLTALQIGAFSGGNNGGSGR
jgi:hypothetical protein